MSNILTTNLPTKIKIKDKLYDINYDYRTVINILIAFEDPNLNQYEKLYIMIKNLYKEEIPDEDLQDACEKAIRFIDCDQSFSSKSSDKRVYSFKKDGNYIFSGINATHNIDVEEKKDLHWWKFMNFFMDMSPDCMFGEITYYRSRKNEGKLTDEEKKQYKKIKNIIDLDEEQSHEQSEARKQFFAEFYKN